MKTTNKNALRLLNCEKRKISADNYMELREELLQEAAEGLLVGLADEGITVEDAAKLMGIGVPTFMKRLHTGDWTLRNYHVLSHLIYTRCPDILADSMDPLEELDRFEIE